MAESVVSFLIEKLESLLVEEAGLLRGVGSEVRDLRDEFESMRAFLRDADTRGESNEVLRAWVKQVRQVAYDTEDVLDEFLLQMAQHSKSIAFLRKPTRPFKELKRRHQIATQIQEIKTRVRDIKERSQRYELNFSEQKGSTSAHMNHDPRIASLYVEEAEIVGIDKPRDELTELLVEGESRRTVIAVVGMGGLGKTTLVKKIFDHQRVRRHFQCYAWVTVSKSFLVQELLISIIKQFCEARKESVPQGIDTAEEVQLMGNMRDYLQHKRYVVFFDDVWSVDSWELIQHALPLNNCGSRVMVTTRISDVASYCTKTSNCLYNLQPLPSQEALKLFCKRAFPLDHGDHYPRELEELSLKIVKRCGGLPLAVVAIGGLLSTKGKRISEWNKLHDSLGSALGTNPILANLSRILLLSYSDLSYHLKSCFLYFAIFPEDYDISCARLIRLWVAEGYATETRGKTLEEVVEDYLNELIDRSLIQRAGTYFDGRIRSCRVHDVLRELILSKCEEESFCKVLMEQNTSLHENTRRLSIHNNALSVPRSKNFSHLRSLFMFGVEKLQNSVIHTLASNIKLLKVLDLQDAALESFPDEIVNLFHLRYLSLKNTNIRVLPKLLGKLQNLETLNLRSTGVGELPIGMLKLQRLRHLLAYSYDFASYPTFSPVRGLKVHEGIGCLTSIQKLSMVEAKRGAHTTRELGNLTQLRRLGIIKMRYEDGAELCASIEKMKYLCSLSVTSIDKEELLDLQSISSPPWFIQRLYLDGRLEKLPNWIPLLSNLVRLRLGWSRLSNKSITVLYPLPNLLELYLYQAYDGEQLIFEGKGFQRLARLEFRWLDRLKLVIIEEGAMPLLQGLSIQKCVQLKKVPLGMEYLTNLKQLDLYDMPDDFERELLYLVLDSEDHKQFKHISDIFFHVPRQGGFSFYSRAEFSNIMLALRNQMNFTSLSFEHLFDEYKQTLLDCNYLNM
ncbi:hypothetical protein HHK36_005874 [Tetracentron sinense]|uniref:Disease resistance protein RPM1-like n=1 Tax=Tetracentron sinense TaxID=13715 RepID=A0A834ZQ90_TETSI|nr:hypothetical protein HHK36_005874 [Tetracentron sinense]